MNPIKQKLIAAKNSIQEHQTQILSTALVLTTTAAVVQSIARHNLDKFITEKGLHDECYGGVDEEY